MFTFCFSLELAIGQDFPYSIEKERLEYFFHSGKNKYDGYSGITDLTITCNREYKVLNDEGISRLSNFTLPEPLDPVYEERVSKIRNTGFYLDGLSIEEISIRVVTNEKSRNIETSTHKIESNSIFSENRLDFGTVFQYIYEIPNLRIGDIVKIQYQLVIPPELNAHELGSFRVFLHSDVPKNNVQIRIKKSESALAIYNYRNGSEPHSSITSDVIIDKWAFDYLPPILSEIQSQPGSDAPFIEIVTGKSNLYGLMTPRFQHVQGNKEELRIGSTYTNAKLTQRYIDSLFLNQEQDSAIMLKTALNSTVKFEYLNDSSYFAGEKFYQPSYGEDLQEKRIRESNKYETYAALIDAVNGEYVILTPMDKRVGRLTHQYVRSLYAGENILGILTPMSGMAFFLPKSNECAYYLDELPFYFEGSKMLLHDFTPINFESKAMALTFDTRFQGWHIERPMIESPSSTEQENTRKCIYNTEVNLKNKSISTRGRLSLAGQFSTLCRSMYVCDEATPFVNEQYNQRIWDNRASAQSLDHSIVSQSDIFPFPIRFDFSFMEPVLYDEESEIFTFDIGGFINHVDYALDTSNDRQLPFYPDFLQTDNYSFMVQFDESVEMIDLPESIIMGSALGSYQFSVKFENNTLRVFSQLMIDNPKIETEEFPSAVKVYQAIQKVENTTIQFRKIN